jgi:hypothetical protein
MPKIIRNQLHVKQLEILPAGLHADGGNLYLKVSPADTSPDGEAIGGVRSWVFRYTGPEGDHKGKPRAAGLGPLRDVSLKDARDLASGYRDKLRRGIDPLTEQDRQRRAQAQATALAITFEQCGRAYVGKLEKGWKSPVHRRQWHSTLESYVYPVIGNLPVSSIDAAAVMRVLEPIWSTKPETASRVRGRIERILDWAKVENYRAGENPARWKGGLEVPKTLRRRTQAGAASSLPGLETGSRVYGAAARSR